MRTSLYSFISLALLVPVSKKQRVNGLYNPLLDPLRTVPFFIRSPTKRARVKDQMLLEPALISTRAVPPLLTCKRAFIREIKIPVYGKRQTPDSRYPSAVIYVTFFCLSSTQT